MSKRKGARKKRRGKACKAVICPRCHTPADGSPAALLGSLAAVLNACQDAGLSIGFRHGAAYSPKGYVLPLKGGRWTARTLAYNPFAPADEADDEDD